MQLTQFIPTFLGMTKFATVYDLECVVIHPSKSLIIQNSLFCFKEQ